jgi:outer membrane protein OmpA-like peptidoglycan-associated protein
MLIATQAASAQMYALTSEDFFIYYDSDSYEIDAQQEAQLTSKILEIGGTNIKEIYVEGHTDSFATSEYNAILANNRALRAAAVLETIGVPSRFIKMESFGESQIISEKHEANRRVKIFFVYETDIKSSLNPPKWIVIKTIDKKTRKPITASLGFDYRDKEMKFSSTGRSGISAAYSMLGEELEVMASAPSYLSTYFTVPPEDIDKPVDTLVYLLALPKVIITGKFTFQNIYFFTDSDEMRPESTPELQKLLVILQRDNKAYIEIQGHMNYPLSRRMNSVQHRYNMELSFKRAKAINDYLVVSGVSQERLTYKGMSNTRMKFNYPANKQQEDQNKRVEIYTLKQI